MATYKVIQDIEAEDKLLGPLSLRQFIYAVVVIVLGFVAFELGKVQVFLATPFLPPMIFFGMLAAPFGHDQSSEVWLLAKIRFALKPRKRIWDQSGIKDLVTITVPKKLEVRLTDGLSQHEVKSRLSALASTLDSRGWAVKNVDVNMFNQPSYLNNRDDRLVNTMSLPQEVSGLDITASDDILDENNNQTAQQFQSMIDQSSEAHRQAITQQMQGQQVAQANTPQANPMAGADYWYAGTPQQPAVATPPQAAPAIIPVQTTYATPQTVTPAAQATPAAPAVQAANLPLTTEEQAVLEQIHQERSQPNPAQGNLRTIQPLSAKPQEAASPQPVVANSQEPSTQNTTSTLKVNPDIMRLANNDDLNVATIAREANKSVPKSQASGDEVVISFH